MAGASLTAMRTGEPPSHRGLGGTFAIRSEAEAVVVMGGPSEQQPG